MKISNKYLIICILVLVAIAAGSFYFRSQQAIRTDLQKASYALGLQFGENLKRQNIKFDLKSLEAAIEDSQSEKPPRVSKEEMTLALARLQEELNQRQIEIQQKQQVEAASFLEENKKKPAVQSTPSGLQYIIEKEGAGVKPRGKDRVVINYTGSLLDGTKFESSQDQGRTAEFPVESVIPGWSEGLKLMKKGGKIKLFIPPELGYGSSPRPGIPGHSVLVMDIELLDVKRSDK